MKIERGIPVPEKTGKPLAYPWPKMRIGDSIVVRESSAPEPPRFRTAFPRCSRQNRRLNTAGVRAGRFSTS